MEVAGAGGRSGSAFNVHQERGRGEPGLASHFWEHKKHVAQPKTGSPHLECLLVLFQPVSAVVSCICQVGEGVFWDRKRAKGAVGNSVQVLQVGWGMPPTGLQNQTRQMHRQAKKAQVYIVSLETDGR